MTDRDNLPAKVTTGSGLLPPASPQNLVTRGLEALQKQPSSTTTDPEEQYRRAESSEDIDDAIKWWRKAAEQGYAEAQHVLACAYWTKQEFILAYMWFYLSRWFEGTRVPRVFFSPAADEQMEQLQKLMTPEQLQEAKRRAMECASKWLTPDEIIKALAAADSECEEDDAS